MLVLVGLSILAAGAGCVTRQETRQGGLKSRAALVVSQAGPDVTFQWDSEPGVRYTVLFTDDVGPQARWEPVPGFAGVLGTGGTVTGRDIVPAGQKRRYRIRTSANRAPGE
jgi:hypothetical protein